MGGTGGNDSGNRNAAVLSVARQWNEAALAAIRADFPRPPVHARNLWHLSAAMYDAWAVYDERAQGYFTTEKITGLNASEISAARNEAVSFAAYRVLKDRYVSDNSTTSLAVFDALMTKLGYDIIITSTEGNTPSAIGNRIAAAVISAGINDGANQAGNYSDATYSATNPPLVFAVPGNIMADPNHWQPISLIASVAQNGIPVSVTQKFVCSQWDSVKSFAIPNQNGINSLIDLGPPPQLGGTTDAIFKAQMMEVVEKSRTLSPDLPAILDISPGAYGNNSLGGNDGHGRPLNPMTGTPTHHRS